MPITDITNPDVIKFLNESYEKTALLRMRWNELNKASLQDAATLHREEKGYFETDVLKESMAAGMPTITRDHKEAARNRKLVPLRDAAHTPGIADMRKGHSIVDSGLGTVEEDPLLGRPDTDLRIDPKMRPVDPKQKRILYKEVPVFGREVYLKSRYKIDPEQKYYFKETTGWDYGWRLKDSFFGHNAPMCGRVWRLTRDVRSRTGPQPDPAHYKDSDIPGPSKCSK